FPTMDFHVAPKSSVMARYGLKSSNRYPLFDRKARPTTCFDARTPLTYASSRTPTAVALAVASFQLAPPSRVRRPLPSLAPAQMTAAVIGDSEIDEIANHGIPPGTPPSDDGRTLSAGLVLRSGLISVQWSP